MKNNELSRREFIIASAGAAACLLAASLPGCSGGSSGGSAKDTTSSPKMLYQGQRGITAVYRTTNSSLYRQLLPAAFQMPDSMQVVVAVVSYYSVTQPLVPYHEGYVMLQCKYQGQAGVYTVTMPVDDTVAYDGGRGIGFPKYIADRIDLDVSAGVWNGQVTYRGRTVLRMRFTPGGETQTYSSTNPGSSCFNLVPPVTGPQILSVNIVGQQLISARNGTVTIDADPAEPWAGLLEGATPVLAQFSEITGNWTLVSGNELKSEAVSIVKIRNDRVDLAVEEAVGLLGGIDLIARDKRRIMLKPNLVTENVRSTTKPEVVGALARIMQNSGREVVIGEGSATCGGFNVVGGTVYRTTNSTVLNGMQQRIFDVLGYSALAASLGIPLINLHTGEMSTVAVPDGYVYDSISMHHSLTEIDMLCSVPMMKTHILGGVTLGMKNLIGTYPGSVYGSVRSLVHDRAARLESSGVAAAVVDIVRANKVGLVVVDGSVAMEGNGPDSGTLVKMDLIIAGTNPLATDMVAASIMGFSPLEIPTFQWANKAGMQPQRLSQIEIRGESIASVQRDFIRPNIATWQQTRSYFGATELPS